MGLGNARALLPCQQIGEHIKLNIYYFFFCFKLRQTPIRWILVWRGKASTSEMLSIRSKPINSTTSEMTINSLVGIFSNLFDKKLRFHNFVDSRWAIKLIFAPKAAFFRLFIAIASIFRWVDKFTIIIECHALTSRPQSEEWSPNRSWWSRLKESWAVARCALMCLWCK